MNTVLAIQLLLVFFYFLIRFARQEQVQDEYEEAVNDIESRLEWAHSRKSFPFGMKAQLEVCSKLLGQAKRLWKENKWRKAYRVALQSQEAMDRAQKIYTAIIRKQR